MWVWLFDLLYEFVHGFELFQVVLNSEYGFAKEFGFTNIAVICTYLEGDLRRIKPSVFIGALVPLVLVLVWNAVAVGLAAEAKQVVDPVSLLYG